MEALISPHFPCISIPFSRRYPLPESWRLTQSENRSLEIPAAFFKNRTFCFSFVAIKTFCVMRKLNYVDKPTSFPLFGSVSAGFPSPAADYAESPLSLDEYCIRNRAATFLLTVEGDSMNGAGIFDGDVVVIDRSVKPQFGDIVVARVENEFLIKHLRKQGTLIFLSPANPAYPPIILEENMSVEVWGPVVSVIRRLK